MSNSISNSKLTVMVAAVASVLLAGIGMNSAAYAVLRDGEFFGISIDDIGQSAECVGVLVECRDNSHNIKVKDGVRGGDNGNGDNGNGDNGNGPLTCQECFTEAGLTPIQIEQFFDEMDIVPQYNTVDQFCGDYLPNPDVTPGVVYDALIAIGLSDEAANDLVSCLYPPIFE